MPHRRAHVAHVQGTSDYCSGPIKELILYDSTYMKAAKKLSTWEKNLTNTEFNPELYIFFKSLALELIDKYKATLF